MASSIFEDALNFRTPNPTVRNRAAVNNTEQELDMEWLQWLAEASPEQHFTILYLTLLWWTQPDYTRPYCAVYLNKL